MTNYMSGVMPGVQRQIIGEHSADAVAYPRSIDRRDYGTSPCEEPHRFYCSKLVHFTENHFAAAIGSLNNDEPFRFKAKPWCISSTTFLKLSWWSPIPHSSFMDEVNRNLPNIWNESDDILNSSALNGNSFCGPIGFLIEWDDILEQYAASRRKTIDDVELRILGTFRYKSEIMYAVLVCARGDFADERYPFINAGGSEAFEPGLNQEYFTWKVYSTVGFSRNERNPDVDWTWDHISFGFHCPTSDLIIEPQLCRIIEKKSTQHMPSSRSQPNEIRTPETMVASEQLLEQLQQKTRR